MAPGILTGEPCWLDKRNIPVRGTRPWTEQDTARSDENRDEQGTLQLNSCRSPARQPVAVLPARACFTTSFQGGSEERGSEGARLGAAGCPCGRSLRCERSLHPASVPYLDEGVVGSRDQVACAQAEMRRR